MQARASERYAFHSADGRSWADHPQQGFTSTLRGARMAVDLPGEAGGLQLALLRAGCRQDPKPVAPPDVSVHKNRVELSRERLTEWYVHGPLGLQQGFTLARPYDCAPADELFLEIKLDSRLHAEPESDSSHRSIVLRDDRGRIVMRYSDLFAFDADGQPLETSLDIEDDKIQIRTKVEKAKYPIIIDPLVWLQQQKLIAPDAVKNDRFGAAVAVSGDTAVVAAPKASLPGFSEAGAVYVFLRTGTTWALQQKLTAPDPTAFAEFGHSVAIEGDTIAVGAWTASLPGKMFAGAVYIFTRAAATWSLEQKLIASDAAADYRFGGGVGLSQNTLVVGSEWADAGALIKVGAGYVFVRVGTSWSQQAKLLASDRANQDNLGTTAAIHKDTIALGAPGVSQTSPTMRSSVGAGYIFVRSGTTWSQQAKLIPPFPENSDLYGLSIAVSGDIAVLGGPLADAAPTNSGSALIFERSGTSWTLNTSSLPFPIASAVSYGSGVAVDGGRIVVGAVGGVTGSTQDGNATVLTRGSTSWAAEDGMAAADGASGRGIGAAVALSGTTTVLGAPNADAGAVALAGAAYVFIGAVPKANGVACGQGHECSSYNCIDGVCCDTSCGNGYAYDCQVCSKAKGGATDGTCGPAANGTVCLPANGDCDLPDLCDGVSTSCSVQRVKAAGVVCRPAAGACDIEETCNGTLSDCPADLLRPATTLCRPIAGICDLQEYCTGTTRDCPVDKFRPATSPCRLAQGPCDAEELCPGDGSSCPPDGLKPATAVCRASVGPCDPAEYCSGTALTCPSDSLAPAGQVCRPSAGACDLAEKCSGTSTSCPGDNKVAAGTECRAAAGPCDVAEVCNGSANTCPSDVIRPTGAVCRAEKDDCDVAELCNGTDTSCQSDTLQSDGSACGQGSCQRGSCRAEADLALSASADSQQVSARRPMYVTIRTVNAGKGTASAVKLRVRLPMTTAFQAARGAGWACQTDAMGLSCNRDTLASGSTDVLSLELLPPFLETEFAISATVESGTHDPNLQNNEVTVQFSNTNPASATGCQAVPGRSLPAEQRSLWALLLLALAHRLRSRRAGPSRTREG